MKRFRPRRFACSLASRIVAPCAALSALSALFAPTLALAQIKIGLVLSLTGPAASLGIPARDTVAMLPTRIAGQQVQYIVLDDEVGS